MLHGFFDFENFDLDEYEHYEVRKEFPGITLTDFAFSLCIESREWWFKLDHTPSYSSFFRSTCEEQNRECRLNRKQDSFHVLLFSPRVILYMRPKLTLLISVNAMFRLLSDWIKRSTMPNDLLMSDSNITTSFSMMEVRPVMQLHWNFWILLNKQKVLLPSIVKVREMI